MSKDTDLPSSRFGYVQNIATKQKRAEPKHTSPTPGVIDSRVAAQAMSGAAGVMAGRQTGNYLDNGQFGHAAATALSANAAGNGGAAFHVGMASRSVVAPSPAIPAEFVPVVVGVVAVAAPIIVGVVAAAAAAYAISEADKYIGHKVTKKRQNDRLKETQTLLEHAGLSEEQLVAHVIGKAMDKTYAAFEAYPDQLGIDKLQAFASHIGVDGRTTDRTELLGRVKERITNLNAKLFEGEITESDRTSYSNILVHAGELHQKGYIQDSTKVKRVSGLGSIFKDNPVKSYKTRHTRTTDPHLLSTLDTPGATERLVASMRTFNGATRVSGTAYKAGIGKTKIGQENGRS